MIAGAPARDRGYAQAALAYQALAEKDEVSAIDHARQAVDLSPQNPDYLRLLLDVLVSVDQLPQAEAAATLEQQHEAHQVFVEARAAGAFDQIGKLELAYLASSAGDDATAKTAFDEADRAGELPFSALEDAAFTSTRAGNDRSALAYFQRSIDAVAAGEIKGKSAQQQFDTRRAVATIDREFGLIASLMRSGGGLGAGAGSQPGAFDKGGTLQAGTEAYWRPFGYNNGSTGAVTSQAAIGARWKPWRDQNVVVSLARLAPLGAQARSDWLVQLGYSDGVGIDLRVDRPLWWTTQWYLEAGHYFQHPQTYGLASAQAGLSFRLDGIAPRLVAFPHVMLNADYKLLNSRRRAVGPAINLRYWFREDSYHAPRSYVEMLLQYRLNIGGGDRARGVFMMTLSY